MNCSSEITDIFQELNGFGSVQEFPFSKEIDNEEFQHEQQIIEQLPKEQQIQFRHYLRQSRFKFCDEL